MQSASYVPGVSGWKMHKDGRLEVEGVVRVTISPSADEPPKPFIVVDGVTYISQAEVDSAFIPKAKLAPEWSVKVQLLNGQYVAAGIGLGLDSQFLFSAERFAINERGAGQILDDLVSHISMTQLGSSLTEKIQPVADTVLDVLRKELQPGGILHRN